MVAEGF
jgi:hypothetical protein